MDKLCRGSFRLLTCRGSVPWRNRTSPASGTSVGWQPTGRLKLGLNAVRPKVQQGRRWYRSYPRIRSVSMGLTEGVVRPARVSLGAKAEHRPRHRSMPGSVHSSCLVQVATGGRPPKVLAAPMMPGAEGTWRRRNLVPKVPSVQGTDGATKRITASSPASRFR